MWAPAIPAFSQPRRREPWAGLEPRLVMAGLAFALLGALALTGASARSCSGTALAVSEVELPRVSPV